MDDRTAAHLRGALQTALRRASDHSRTEALGLQLSQRFSPTPLDYIRYPPSLSVVLAGRKRSIVGDDDQQWGAEHFIITPVDLPVMAGIVEVDPAAGFVSGVWRLDPVVVTDVATHVSRPRWNASRSPRLGTWSAELADAFARFVGLLDRPEEIPVLAPLVERELIFRLLQTDQAPRILAASGGRDGDIVTVATTMLTRHMERPWTIRQLAAAVATSESTLFARFRNVTGMTPLEYLRRVRLGEARRRMVVLGDTASRTAAAVGYRSASHFSRDYRTLHGRPPAEDAARARRLLGQEDARMSDLATPPRDA